MSAYKNPWHKPGNPMYGPAEYQTEVIPDEYKGYLIYQRITGAVWDVVKGGACITQRAGPRGARQAIEEILGSQS